MSELWKKHAPRLSEDEERRLWERVRTVPDEVAAERATERQRDSGVGAGARPWWRGLFAAPAFRFGAPALAVLVAATLFVLQQNPRAPVTGTVAQREVGQAPESAPAPSPETGATGPRAADERVGADAPGTLNAPSEPSAPSPEGSAGRGARVSGGEFEAMAKDRSSANATGDQDAGKKTFASEPPAAPPTAPSPRVVYKEEPRRSTTGDQLGAAAPATPPKVAVIKGGKESSERRATSTAPAAPAPAPSPVREEAVVPQPADELQQKVAEGSASEPEAKASSGVASLYRNDDAPTPPWQGIVAGTAHANRWIEVIPSMFDDGAVVVLAGTSARGLGLLPDATMLTAAPRPTPFVRDAASGRWGVAQWVYDRDARGLNPVIVKLASPRGPVERGWTVTRRVTFRDAPQEVQIAFLATEGERTTAISAQTTAIERFDRILHEARQLQTRRPTDARLQRLVAALTNARATLR